MQHIINFFRVDTSKAGIRRGVMALTIMLWVLAWIMLGASTARVGDLYSWPKTFAFGLFGLVSGGVLLTLWQRQSIERAMIVVVMGLIPVGVVSVWMGISVPQYLTSMTLPNAPQELRLEDIEANRPKLPAYVSIQGYPVPEFTRTTSYTRRDPVLKRTRTHSFSELPLVDANWSTTDPVLVIMDSDAYKSRDTRPGKVIATGILYRITSNPGERPWFSPPIELAPQSTADWYQNNAPFQFDPDNLYFLSDASPSSGKVLLIVFSTFTLAFIAVVVRMSMGSAPDNSTVDSPSEKSHRRGRDRRSSKLRS